MIHDLIMATYLENLGATPALPPVPLHHQSLAINSLPWPGQPDLPGQASIAGLDNLRFRVTAIHLDLLCCTCG